MAVPDDEYAALRHNLENERLVSQSLIDVLARLYARHREATFHSPRMRPGECQDCDTFRAIVGTPA